jgi:hypothetical protein
LINSFSSSSSSFKKKGKKIKQTREYKEESLENVCVIYELLNGCAPTHTPNSFSFFFSPKKLIFLVFSLFWLNS